MPAQSAKTIKQAKEAFKKRHDNPLTDKEQKQLQRSIALEQRAWGLREREKNRQDAVKKRTERDKKQKAEERLGTQRKLDRHGFASSQFHLGAFFGKSGRREGGVRAGRDDLGAGSAEATGQDGPPGCSNLDGADDFDDVDDESLLEALRSPESARVAGLQPDRTMPPPPKPALSKPQQPEPVALRAETHTEPSPLRRNTSMPRPPPPKPAASHQPQASKPTVQIAPSTDTSGFDDIGWDFLDSSTQIARELSMESSLTAQPPEPQQPAAPPRPATGSFSSGSFDFTEEDLEELDPTPRMKATAIAEVANAEDRWKMPPPPPFMSARSMLPTPGEMKKGEVSAPSAKEWINGHSGTHFTMTQLESFVEDDLQLTQVATG